MNLDAASIWRIKRIPYDQFGNYQYKRVYGWGWLSPTGVLCVVGGAIGLAGHWRIDEGVFAAIVFLGFFLAFAGLFLNGISERRAMKKVMARCLDVEVNKIGSTTSRMGHWAVRVLAEYSYEGQTHQSTPMRIFTQEESARLFAENVKKSPLMELYIDPKRPKRSLF